MVVCSNNALAGVGSCNHVLLLRVPEGEATGNITWSTLPADYAKICCRRTKTPTTVRPMGRLALVWSPLAAVTVKAMYGRAFKNPHVLDMFIDLPPVITPNPALRAATQDTFELAVDIGLPAGVTVRSSVFHNTYRDAIMNQLHPHLSGTTSTNSDTDVTTYGAHGSVLWSRKRLRVELSAAVQRCNSEEGCVYPAPTLLGQTIVTWRPPFTETARLTSRFHGRSGIGVMDPAFDLDAGLLWQVHPSAKFTFTGRRTSIRVRTVSMTLR